MEYDSVLKYVDEVATTFNKFALPALLVPPSDPTAAAGTNIYRMVEEIDLTQVFEDAEYRIHQSKYYHYYSKGKKMNSILILQK